MNDNQVRELLIETRKRYQNDKRNGITADKKEVFMGLLNVGVKREQMHKILMEIKDKEGW